MAGHCDWPEIGWSLPHLELEKTPGGGDCVHTATILLAAALSGLARHISETGAATTPPGLLTRSPRMCTGDAHARTLEWALRLRQKAAAEAAPGASRLQARLESELRDLPDATPSRLAGATNNLCAIEWELDVWAWAPEPVALSTTTNPPGCSFAEVDVVAAGGLWWVEAKARHSFGLGSTAWADLKQQVHAVGVGGCAG